MLAHMQFVCTKERGPIYIGGLITSIVCALNLNEELATLQPIQTPFLYMDSFQSMCMIKNRSVGNYYLMVQNLKIKGVILPCLAHTDV